MKKIAYTLSICIAMVLTGIGNKTFAQDKYAADVESQDAIIKALYASISGDKGVARDWDRFFNLFAEGAQLVPSRKNEEGRITLQIWTPEAYKERAREYLEGEGFFEKETHRVTETYGTLAHVWSTYDSYHTSTDSEPFARGINSIQLLHDGDRWYVVQIYWLGETKDNPIPAKYLP